MEYYKKSKEISKVLTNTNREKKLLRVNQIKLKRGCEICGYNKHAVALDFDHINRETKFKSVSQMFTCSWERIQKEIDKCRVLCANCHRIETYKHSAMIL